MSVSFGKPKTAVLAVYGAKTSLTKRLRDQGFVLHTSLDVKRIQEIMAATCKNYPVKTRRFVGDIGPLFCSTPRYENVVSYGLLAVDKSGKQRVIDAKWIIGLNGPRNGQEKSIKLFQAKLVSGKILEVEELEHYLNELEQNLQAEDPDAAITLNELPTFHAVDREMKYSPR
jgi:hypothetical protein